MRGEAQADGRAVIPSKGRNYRHLSDHRLALFGLWRKCAESGWS